MADFEAALMNFDSIKNAGYSLEEIVSTSTDQLIERDEFIRQYEEDEEVVLNFPDPGGFDGDIIQLERAKFGYDDNSTLLKDIDLTIGFKSRIALLGK